MAIGVTARQTKVGIKKASTWGTAVTVGAGNGYHLIGDYRDEPVANVSMNDAATQQFIHEALPATIKTIATVLPMFLIYKDTWQNLLWALAFGQTGGAPTHSGTLAYQQYFTPAPTRSGVFGTLVRDKGQNIVELPSFVCDGFTLKVGANGRLEIDWSIIGIGGVADGSATNGATQITNLTFVADGFRAFFHQTVFRINAQGGGALGSSDALPITGLTLTFKQPMDQRYVGGSQSITEPADNGMPTVQLAVTCARYNSQSSGFIAGQLAQTAYKADLTITGPIIESSTHNELLFSFPHLQINDNPQYPLANGGTQSAPAITFNALAATAAPTGMTGILDYMRLDVTGTMATDPLA